MKDKNFTGIPKELQPWEGFSRDTQSVKISVDKRRYGKSVTIIEGIDPKEEDIYEIAKVLKKKVASGGTVKDGKTVELQGEHRSEVRKILDDMGFKTEVVGNV
ncbi:MAG: translation initiation factor [Candidatus Thermoplasmatota archaeon]|jgi:translation initiation factor 1|nr:translation initiation factor [Candidatus Thermoplasmatota archaeon]